jgi:methylmalonyl-CoA/ethylmalonyl-CoA epimerase
VQIGVVVRDLEATMRKYVHDYGIGPWDIYEFSPGNAKGLREHGQPVDRSWRLAATMVGQVQWELIQPLDDESVYARFLAEKGEGVHHIAVATPSFDEAVAAQSEREKTWFSAASSAASGSRTWPRITSSASSPRSSAAHPAPT